MFKCYIYIIFGKNITLELIDHSQDIFNVSILKYEKFWKYKILSIIFNCLNLPKYTIYDGQMTGISVQKYNLNNDYYAF